MTVTIYFEQSWTLIISALLTIAVLAYSVFAATYSNFLHGSETAWVNWRLKNPTDKGRDYWRRLAEEYRRGAQARACSGNLSFWSLISAIASLILAIFTGWNWLIPFWISIGFLIAAFVIFIREGIPQCTKKLVSILLKLGVPHRCIRKLVYMLLKFRVPHRCKIKLVSVLRRIGPLGGNVPQLWTPLKNQGLEHLREHFWHYHDNRKDC